MHIYCRQCWDEWFQLPCQSTIDNDIKEPSKKKSRHVPVSDLVDLFEAMILSAQSGPHEDPLGRSESTEDSGGYSLIADEV